MRRAPWRGRRRTVASSMVLATCQVALAGLFIIGFIIGRSAIDPAEALARPVAYCPVPIAPRCALP